MQHLVPGATLGKNFTSPFRVDKGPGCWLMFDGTRLRYFDPKDPLRNKKDIIELWMLEKNSKFKQSLLQISKFSGGPSYNTRKKYTKQGTPKHFDVGLRKWEDYDELYWGPRDLSIEDLETGTPKLLPCKWYEYYSSKMKGLLRKYSTPKNPLYVYVWEDAYKVYAPLSKQKFIGNSTGKHVYYYEGNGTLMVCSGGKDAKIVNKHLGYTTLALNGEMYDPSNLDLTYFIDKKVLIGLDNDNTGITFAKKLKQYLNNHNINPYICLPRLKDWDEDYIIFKNLCEELLIFLDK